ncbi:MAG: hypothetical protein H7837_07975 [Magnetococcus sp. MYC-9]
MTRWMVWVVGLLLLWTSNSFAQEETTRPSEREIPEALLALKQDLQQRFETLHKSLETLQQNMGEIHRRAEEIGKQNDALWGENNKRTKEMNKEIHRRLEENGKRTEAFQTEFNRRSELYEQTVLALFGGVFLLLLIVLRALSRLRDGLPAPTEPVKNIEHKSWKEVQALQHNSTRLHALLEALRTQAKEDEKLATVLRSFSLMT